MMKKTGKSILMVVFLWAMFAVSGAYAQALPSMGDESRDWNISDYYDHLPSKYMTFMGDHCGNKEDCYKVMDIQNGYIALLPHQGSQENVFKMAMFRSPARGTLIAISNRRTDEVCTDYDNYFLKKVDGKWLDVSSEVLPELGPVLFYQNLRWPQYILDNNKSFSYLFNIPHHGTSLDTYLEVCDYFEDESPLSYHEQQSISTPDFYLHLIWDSKQGKFLFSKTPKKRITR